MSDFPKTLTHRDGRERVVDNAREEVSAKFDGFTELSRGQKAAATRARKAAAKPKRASRKASTTVSPTEAAKGAPAADSTTNPAGTKLAAG